MTKKIAFITSDGGVAIIFPCLESGLTIEQIALKDVPVGKPYKIISDDDIPSDMTFRSAWELNVAAPDGHGADYGHGSKNVVIGWNDDGTPVLEYRDNEPVFVA